MDTIFLDVHIPHFPMGVRGLRYNFFFNYTKILDYSLRTNLYIHCSLSGTNLIVLSPQHREITLIELQSLVVFGCAALLFMVGATASTHDREEGWDDFLYVYTE